MYTSSPVHTKFRSRERSFTLRNSNGGFKAAIVFIFFHDRPHSVTILTEVGPDPDPNRIKAIFLEIAITNAHAVRTSSRAEKRHVGFVMEDVIVCWVFFS